MKSIAKLSCRFSFEDKMKLDNKILRLPDWAFVFTVALIITSTFLLLHRPLAPEYDQLFSTYLLSSGYPAFSEGISSLFIAGIVNLFHPTTITVSSLIVRIISAVLFLLSVSILSWNIFTRYGVRWAFFPCLAIIFTSQFPFFWLSSELLVGAWLMFAFWSFLSRRNFIFTSIFLVFYCLAKPDCIFSGVLLGIYMILLDKTQTRKHIITFALILFLFMIPGVINNPNNYSRADVSFSQHYALLVHERTPDKIPGDPWLVSEQYILPVFGTTKLSKIIIKHPREYLGFVKLSINKSFRNMVISGILFLFIITLYGLWTIRTKEFKMTMLVICLSLVPIILFSFCHIRYLARFFPLLIITSLIVANKSNRIIRTIVFSFLAIFFLTLCYRFFPIDLSNNYDVGEIWLTHIFGVDF